MLNSSFESNIITAMLTTYSNYNITFKTYVQQT